MISGVRASSIRIEFDLVHYRVVERPMHHVLDPEFHVVAQIVEPQLVVGAVGHVGGIGLLPLGIVEAVDDAIDREPEKTVDLAHPFGVAAGQIVIDGDDVNAVAGQRVQVDRQGGDQGLPLAGLHLGDHAAVQHDPAHQLHIEMPLAQRPLRSFAHGGERLDQDVVEIGAVGELLLEMRSTPEQLVVRHRLQLRFERVDRGDDRAKPLDEAIIGGAEQPPG